MMNIVLWQDWTWGADDYISKPFGPRGASFKGINSVLRRRLRTRKTLSAFRHIVVDKSSNRGKKGTEILLSAMEYKLLFFVKDIVLSQRRLLELLHGTLPGFISDNALTVYMKAA